LRCPSRSLCLRVQASNFDNCVNPCGEVILVSYKVSFSLNHGVALAFIVGLIAGLTYLIDQNTPITVSMVLMGVIIGLTAALHYEQAGSTSQSEQTQKPPSS